MLNINHMNKTLLPGHEILEAIDYALDVWSCADTERYKAVEEIKKLLNANVEHRTQRMFQVSGSQPKEWQPEKLSDFIKPKQEEQPCLHDACQGCKDGSCSGVHMISCPCKKCSPWC